MNSVVLALMAAVSYAGSEFCLKLGTTALPAHEVQFIKTLVTTTCFLGVTMRLSGGKLVGLSKGASPLYVAICLFAGLCSFSGGLLKGTAIRNGGPLGTISSLTAIYPALTFLLSVVFLGEELKPNKVVGLCFAMVSALAFAYEPGVTQVKIKVA